MKDRKNHIEALVFFAIADKEFRVEEKEFIMQIGKRMELSDEEINIIMEKRPLQEPELPEKEVQRYVLFDDILNLIAIDGKISAEEEKEAIRIAAKLGFDSVMVTEIVKKLKRHIELGFDTNQISQSMKHSIFALTNKSDSNDKYSI